MQGTSGVGGHGAADGAPAGTIRFISEAKSDGRNQEPSESEKWLELAQCMQASPEGVLHDAPDPDENLFMPAGYTYLAQFVTHDLTFDTRSSLAQQTGPGASTNARTPRFDLDCLYGAGPSDQPYMYGADGATLLLGKTLGRNLDLVRTSPPAPEAARAIIGDPRNDGNSIICQLQIAFIRFHNEVVRRLKDEGRTSELFERARNVVRWTYQRILVEDFLPRLVSAEVRDRFEKQRCPNERGRSTDPTAYRLAPSPLNAIPLEFSKAAFRFGHSMVRNGYRLNSRYDPVHIFGATDAQREHDLVGFEPLEDEHVIDDWSLFFPDSTGEGGGIPRPGVKRARNYDSDGSKRLQYSFKIDTSLVDPLVNLPERIDRGAGRSLILRDLRSGRTEELASGQKVAGLLDTPPLSESKHLRTRRKKPKENESDPTTFEFVQIDGAFKERTPLWFYILAEAQAPMLDVLAGQNFTCDEKFLRHNSVATGTQLGWVGGTIVLETFHGLLDSDPASYRNHPNAAEWTPMIRDFRMWDLVNLNFR
jgi:hypothetical protein